MRRSARYPLAAGLLVMLALLALQAGFARPAGACSTTSYWNVSFNELTARDRKTLVGFGLGFAAAVLGVTVLAVSVAGGRQASRPSTVGLENPIPLQAAGDLAPGLRESLRSVATQNGVDPASLVEAGAATGTHGTAAVIAGTKRGAPVFARVIGSGHSLFIPLSEVMNGRDLRISGGIGGTSTVVKEVSLVGIVSANVATVKIQRADGSEAEATLTKWPRGGYASFALVSDDAAEFPTRVRAFGANGQLLANERTDIAPLCSAANPNCIDG